MARGRTRAAGAPHKPQEEPAAADDRRSITSYVNEGDIESCLCSIADAVSLQRGGRARTTSAPCAAVPRADHTARANATAIPQGKHAYSEQLRLLSRQSLVDLCGALHGVVAPAVELISDPPEDEDEQQLVQRLVSPGSSPRATTASCRSGTRRRLSNAEPNSGVRAHTHSCCLQDAALRLLRGAAILMADVVAQCKVNPPDPLVQSAVLLHDHCLLVRPTDPSGSRRRHPHSAALLGQHSAGHPPLARAQNNGTGRRPHPAAEA